MAANSDTLSRPVTLGVLVSGGVLLRTATTLIAGNRIMTPWRVGGDAPFYTALASNLAHGLGLSYAGQPTAFRPPVYPIFLAGLMELFGAHFAIVARLLQFAVGLIAVWLCWRLASRLFGERAGWAALLVGLYFPTLSLFPTELITECFATCLTAWFFWLTLENPRLAENRTALYLGLIVGTATLLRFNMAILGPVAALLIYRAVGFRCALPRVVIIAVISIAMIMPWIIRNRRVLGGGVLLSTQAGYNALQGVLTPQGRVQAGDVEALRRAGAWVTSDLETNDPRRLLLPSEAVLDRQAWQITRHLWREKGWSLIPIEISKLGYFWLSTDQLTSTADFSWKIRAGRAAGVFAYWVLLALAIAGGVRLWHERRSVAQFLLIYVAIISAVHLPFIMSSRHRIPFAEPLLVVLAAGALVRLWNQVVGRPTLAAGGARAV
jgi:4-amino-4-deoxy-L-arabinose transferase-like glycosyltransferase